MGESLDHGANHQEDESEEVVAEGTDLQASVGEEDSSAGLSTVALRQWDDTIPQEVHNCLTYSLKL